MVSKFLNMCFLSFCNPGPNIFEFILSCYCVGVLTHCSLSWQMWTVHVLVLNSGHNLSISSRLWCNCTCCLLLFFLVFSSRLVHMVSFYSFTMSSCTSFHYFRYKKNHQILQLQSKLLVSCGCINEGRNVKSVWNLKGHVFFLLSLLLLLQKLCTLCLCYCSL